MSKMRTTNKARKPPISKLKKKLDVLVSLYVRKTGKGECYTCGKRGGYKSLQCGHYVHRHINATRYDLDNLREQCVGCNYFGNVQHIFAEKLHDELGEKRWKALLLRAKETKQFRILELQSLVEIYKKKLEDL